MSDRVYIFDTTLRDGEQAAGASMTVEEKLVLARQLEKLGVDVIEAGFPVSSEGDFEAVRRIAQEVRGAEVCGLCRTMVPDIDRAWQAIQGGAKPRLHLFISTSDIHLQRQLGKSREQVHEESVLAIRHARRYTENVEFSCMDATRTDPSYLTAMVTAAVEAGARVINIPDTVGYIIPQEFSETITRLRQEVPGLDRVILSVHCHDDLGLAVANSLAGVMAGARQVECTVNGVGERAGNAALEEIVMALHTRRDRLHFETGIQTEQIYPTSRLVRKLTGFVVQPNKAVVGQNAFAHMSGIHQDGVIKDHLNYEIMTPESVGLPGNRLVLGKLSGRHAFKQRLEELGFDLSDEQFNTAFRRFKALADKKKEIFDEDLETLVMDQVLQIPRKFHLEYLHVIASTKGWPFANVEITVDGNLVAGAERGDGPVDATFKTITKLTGTKAKLLLYSVNAITGGTDAQGEVRVRIEEEGIQTSGFGAHTDIIVASAKAYVDALNRLEYRKQNQGHVEKESL
jgi:2-isopropylmalate synthase